MLREFVIFIERIKFAYCLDVIITAPPPLYTIKCFNVDLFRRFQRFYVADCSKFPVIFNYTTELNFFYKLNIHTCYVQIELTYHINEYMIRAGYLLLISICWITQLITLLLCFYHSLSNSYFEKCIYLKVMRSTIFNDRRNIKYERRNSLCSRYFIRI